MIDGTNPGIPPTASGPITLEAHEAHSHQRYESLCHKLKKLKEHHMSEGTKVENIYKGHGEGGGMGGLGTAAVIAAMGNRNEGGGMAAMLPALMGNRHDGLGMGGFGAGLVGGLLGGALFGGRRGGLFGGGDGDNGGGAETRIESDIFGTAVLSKLGSIEAAIPLASAQTENVILNQTNQITNLASQAQLANAAGFAATKDSVQNLALVLSQAICGVNQNVSAQGCQTREAVQNDGDKTRALLVARFSQEDATRIQNLSNEVTELRNEGRRAAESAELRQVITVNNTATATQAQSQAQFQVQAQFQDLNSRMGRLFDRIDIVHQEQRSTNANIIAGNTGAVVTGAQTSTPTNVNSR